jgi:H+/Cl- antiporter ClcA
LQENFEFLELLPMLLLGVIGGLLGSCFNHLNALLAAWRKQRLLKYGPRGRLWEGLAAALLTSTVSFLLPMMVACQVCFAVMTLTTFLALFVAPCTRLWICIDLCVRLAGRKRLTVAGLWHGCWQGISEVMTCAELRNEG